MVRNDAYTLLVTGVLLDDLLVAEDLAAAETTSAASHAAAAAAASDVQPGRVPGSYASVDQKMRRMGHDASDGAIMLGNPVAPPINGGMYADITPENAMNQGTR